MPRSGALPAIKGMVTLKIRYIIAIGGPTILHEGNGHASILKYTLPCNGLDNLINIGVSVCICAHNMSIHACVCVCVIYIVCDLWWVGVGVGG